MKSFRSFLIASALAMVAAVGIGAISACAQLSAAPNDALVAQIKSACLVDASLRPTVTVLAAALATPAENQALTMAHATIDQVCANPSASIEANTLTLFSESTAQVVNILAQLQARKAKAAAPAALPAAAASSAA